MRTAPILDDLREVSRLTAWARLAESVGQPLLYSARRDRVTVAFVTFAPDSSAPPSQ